MDELIYTLFSHLTVGGRDEKEIIQFFGGRKQLFEAVNDERRFCPLITERALKRMERTDADFLERVINQCAENGWHIVTEDSADYPPALKGYDDSPSVLFVSGDVRALNGTVCVAGTRKMDEKGAAACEKAAAAVHECGRKVLSFATPGCDSRAVECGFSYGSVCVAAAGGLGSYAGTDRRAVNRAEDSGAVVSTLLPYSRATLADYHVRNRLASRLCDAAIIVQADVKSNSLHVASVFSKAGKPVFAVAGSPGCDEILNDYAYIMRSPLEETILYHSAGELPRAKRSAAPAENKKEYNDENNLDNLSQNSIIVYNILKESGGNADMDVIVLKSGLPGSDVISAITELELFGIISTDAGNRCVLL